MRLILLALFILSFASCKHDHNDKQNHHPTEEKVKAPTQGEQIILDAIKAHGGDRYETANYSFVFRKKEYTFKNNGDQYTYQVSSCLL